jgi:hypothetical protein
METNEETNNVNTVDNNSTIDSVDNTVTTRALDSADLGASKPVPQPVQKAQPIQHSTVVACGHSLEAGHFPRKANCEDCWYALFETTPEGVASVHSLLMQEGTQAVERMHGRKFLKHFGLYLKRKLLALHSTPTSDALEVPDLSLKSSS